MYQITSNPAVWFFVLTFPISITASLFTLTREAATVCSYLLLPLTTHDNYM